MDLITHVQIYAIGKHGGDVLGQWHTRVTFGVLLTGFGSRESARKLPQRPAARRAFLRCAPQPLLIGDDRFAVFVAGDGRVAVRAERNFGGQDAVAGQVFRSWFAVSPACRAHRAPLDRWFPALAQLRHLARDDADFERHGQVRIHERAHVIHVFEHLGAWTRTPTDWATISTSRCHFSGQMGWRHDNHDLVRFHVGT